MGSTSVGEGLGLRVSGLVWDCVELRMRRWEQILRPKHTIYINTPYFNHTMDLGA